MRKNWGKAFPAVETSFENSMESAFRTIKKDNRVAVKKSRTWIILAAALVLISTAAFAAANLNVFRKMEKNANSIVPLNGAEELVVKDTGCAENEFVSLTVEEAVYDGQGVIVLARLTPKDPDNYALFNAMLMDAPDDVYQYENTPAKVPEGEQEVYTRSGAVAKIINEPEHFAMYVNEAQTAIPQSREEAVDSGLPVYLEEGTMYYTDQWDFCVKGRKDGKTIIGFYADLLGSDGSNDLTGKLLDGLSVEAEDQSDGSVLVWLDAYADELLPAELNLKLRCTVYIDETEYKLDDICFGVSRPEAANVANYIPENPDLIGNGISVRSVHVLMTKVRAYLMVDYIYQPAGNADNGITFHILDQTGAEITTGRAKTWALSAEDCCYRQLIEMQSVEAMPETLTLEAKAIGGAMLGTCALMISR